MIRQDRRKQALTGTPRRRMRDVWEVIFGGLFAFGVVGLLLGGVIYLADRSTERQAMSDWWALSLRIPASYYEAPTSAPAGRCGTQQGAGK